MRLAQKQKQIGATKNKRPDLYQAASPTSYIDQDDPPFYLYHGEVDLLVPCSTTQIMRDQLRAAQVECLHEVVKNKGHFATFSDFDRFDTVIDFFDRTLKGGTSRSKTDERQGRR